jgi:hypothetical protein
MLGAFIPRLGSVYNWTEFFVVCGGSSVICVVLAYFSCMNDPLHNSNYCVALPPPTTVVLTLLTLCSFVISFFVNLVVNRWWCVRCFVGNVYGASLECLMLLGRSPQYIIYTIYIFITYNPI